MTVLWRRSIGPHEFPAQFSRSIEFQVTVGIVTSSLIILNVSNSFVILPCQVGKGRSCDCWSANGRKEGTCQKKSVARLLLQLTCWRLTYSETVVCAILTCRFVKVQKPHEASIAFVLASSTRVNNRDVVMFVTTVRL